MGSPRRPPSRSPSQSSQARGISTAGAGDARRLPVLGPSYPSAGIGSAADHVERADALRNRMKILEAARRLLTRHPIEEICMDEVARAAGVGKGTLYRRFTDRGALCRALLDDSERLLQERVLRGFDRSPEAGALEGLWALLDALLVFAIDHATILAEARAFEGRGARRHELGVHLWRRQSIARALSYACVTGDIATLDVEIKAQFILADLSPDLILWGLAQLKGGADALRLRYLRAWGRDLGISPPETVQIGVAAR